MVSDGGRERFAVRGKLVLGGSLQNGAVIIEGGRIIDISRFARDGDLPARVIDAPIVSPGFIDLQVNGGFGVEVDADPESFRLIARRLPESGVTSYLPLRGEHLPLHWHEGRFARITRQDDGIHVDLPARASAASLRRTLRAFYEAEARTDIGRWLPGYLAGLPRAPRQIRLKVMSSQWGSLAPDGTLTLDLALVLGRPSAFEYVLVHELCHLLQANHSPAFWHEVEARFPAWRDERAWFHAEGRRLKARLRGLLAED